MTKSSVSRRLAALVAVSALALSACGGSSPVASANDAFVVNGTSYPLDTFETLIDDLVQFQQIEAPDGTPSKENVISVMRTLIRYEAYRQFLAENGLKESAKDRASVEAEAAASEGFAELPAYLQKLLVDLSIAQATMAKFKPRTAAALEKLYNASPASTGVMCMSHILVETEDEANEVLKELADGAKFADVAKKKSIEPNADKTGGALENDNEACTDLGFFQQQFDPDFMVGAVAAKAGVPSGPVKTQFGFHIILNRPFSEVRDSLLKAATATPSVSNMAGYLTTADIAVNSKYGVWNGATSTID